MPSAADTLGAPLTLPCGAVIKNRFMKSAMSEVLAGRSNEPSAALDRLYRTWAEGGAGLVVTGNVMIDRRALGEPDNVVVEDSRDMAGLRRWAKAATIDTTSCWVQLNHPGKQSPRFLTPEPVAPSAIPLGSGLEKMFNPPRALTEPEIHDIIERFGRSAALVKEAGFSGVQIHGAHGYLVSQFLSPHHNRREDAWGGDAPRRMRFVMEVYAAIRAAVGPAFPVGIKLNSADFQRGGFTEDESMDVVTALSEAGMDLIEISGGNYERPAMVTGGKRASTREREAFFLDYADKVRARVTAPLAVTGGFRTSGAMAAAVDSGAIDVVGAGRAFTLAPDFPRRILAGEDFEANVDRPSTGSKTLDKMLMLDVTWYENQLARMGRGAHPDPKLSVWRSVASTVKQVGLGAFRKRRS